MSITLFWFFIIEPTEMIFLLISSFKNLLQLKAMLASSHAWVNLWQIWAEL